MSDFGTEVGNTTLQVGGNITVKLLDALMSLIDRVFETWEKSRDPERQLLKEQLKGIKDESAERAFVEKVEGAVGYVKHKDLERAGVPLTATGLTMTNDEFHDFSARCKREGIVVSALVDGRELSMNHRKQYYVECKQVDLKKIAKLVDLMNDEKKIYFIDQKVEEITHKGLRNLTAQDRVDLAELQKHRTGIQRSYCRALNDEQARGIMEKAITGGSNAGVSFDAALNRYTGGWIDKDAECIVADAVNPMRHIKCHGYMDTYNDKPYIKTEYRVYNGGNQVFNTHDGRFDGRPEGYWDAQKDAMHTMGGIGDVVLKFHTVGEYESYLQNFIARNTLDVVLPKPGTVMRNFEVDATALKNRLHECGATINEGVVLDNEIGKTLTVTSSIASHDQYRIAELLLIGKHIEICKELGSLAADLSLAQAKVLTLPEGTSKHERAMKDY